MSRPQFAPRVNHRARARLTRWSHAARWRSGYWQAVDARRAAAAKTATSWPREVYLPVEAAVPIVVQSRLRAERREPDILAMTREALEFCGLSAWRVTQGIYRYDPDVYAALIDTDLSGPLPTEVLLRLPEWCVYIETPGMFAPVVGAPPETVAGVYVWLDWQAKDDTWCLQIGLDTDQLELQVATIPLVGTLDDAIARVVEEWSKPTRQHPEGSGAPAGYAAATRRFIPPILSLVFYLCADDPDFAGAEPPRRPQPTRTKQGYRLFPADRVTRWDVGTRIGAAIRHARETSERESRELTATGRARPRAHIRRAHFHAWRIGPRKDESKQDLRVRWLPPIAVNADSPDDLSATIHPVRG